MWTSETRNPTVRCPYCVQNGQFRPMVKPHAVKWLLCAQCGHMTIPSQPLFTCTCHKCLSLAKPERNASLARRISMRLQHLLKFLSS